MPILSPRTQSPFYTLSGYDTQAACQCIKSQNPAPANPKTAPVATGKSCTNANSDYSAVHAAFKNTLSFCNFYITNSG